MQPDYDAHWGGGADPTAVALELIMNKLKEAARGSLWYLGGALLVLMASMSIAGWLFGGGGNEYGADETDPDVESMYSAQWQEVALRAADESVDLDKREQVSFRLDPRVFAVMVALDPMASGEAGDESHPNTDPAILGELLKPQFTYEKMPIEITTEWTECIDVVEHGISETICLPQIRVDHDEVLMLTEARTWDGITTFNYKLNVMISMEGGKEVRTQFWQLDSQEFQSDYSPLIGVFESFDMTPSHEYLEDFLYIFSGLDDAAFTGGWIGIPPGGVLEVDPGLAKDGWYWPVPASGVITDDYGPRIHPIRGTRDYHTGIDVGGDVNGKPVIAVRNGVVTYAGWLGGYGNRIEVTLDNGAVATYSHLQRFLVRTGQAVSAGEALGLIGSTGNSTGPHLHFELIVDGNFINPWYYLPR